MDNYKQNLKLAFIGFLLTGVLGSLLTFLFNYVQWEYTTNQQVRESKTKDAREALLNTMQLCQKRFWASQRVVWAAESPQYYDFKEVQQEYSEAVEQWNLNLATSRLLVQDSLGNQSAELFVDNNTLVGKGGGKSIQKSFMVFNNLARDFLRSNTTSTSDQYLQMQTSLKEIGEQLDTFYKTMIRGYKYVQLNGNPPPE
jgi:hypothetical protein